MGKFSYEKKGWLKSAKNIADDWADFSLVMWGLITIITNLWILSVLLPTKNDPLLGYCLLFITAFGSYGLLRYLYRGFDE